MYISIKYVVLCAHTSLHPKWHLDRFSRFAGLTVCPTRSYIDHGTFGVCSNRSRACVSPSGLCKPRCQLSNSTQLVSSFARTACIKAASQLSFTCSICDRPCASKIGLYGHSRKHSHALPTASSSCRRTTQHYLYNSVLFTFRVRCVHNL